MPMEDVGRLLDTLDEGYAEATGEQPAVPAQDPGTEIIPGTGQYHRPPQHSQQPPPAPQPEERQAASLSPNDVLVARGNPPQDKLVASYNDTTAPRDTTPAYGDHRPFTGPQYVEPNQYTEQPAPQYEQTGPQPAYTGDPFSGPQYTADPLSGPHYTQPAQPDPFTGPQYVDEPVYQMPGEQRRPSPLSTDPLGFPSQAADPYQAPPARSDYAADPYPSDPYPSDPYGSRHSDAYQQPQPSAAGLGTPMHGIPGAGRPRPMPQRRQQPAQPARDDYAAPQPGRDDYAAYQTPPPNPVDPLLALGRQEYTAQPGGQADPGMSRPYVGDPMFSTGERLRPEQQEYPDGGDRREW
ncbi:hypothetical protein [Nonomuraea aridisoli]|uniref:Uncharacterized protein n=1 Tax=Nonomuraea aridisoli TaxID=2070368 RepID=A0A2W2E7M4_9ACTN|nr:hypothetical protein [Nonomuraea aridisoli]PZG12679.1 hypothetical protein C1J01_32150 [Nonomuraea aridisoli]